MLSVFLTPTMEQYASKHYTYLTTESRENHGENTLFNSQLIKEVFFNNSLILNLLHSSNYSHCCKHFFHTHYFICYTSVFSVSSVVNFLSLKLYELPFIIINNTLSKIRSS